MTYRMADVQPLSKADLAALRQATAIVFYHGPVYGCAEGVGYLRLTLAPLIPGERDREYEIAALSTVYTHVDLPEKRPPAWRACLSHSASDWPDMTPSVASLVKYVRCGDILKLAWSRNGFFPDSPYASWAIDTLGVHVYRGVPIESARQFTPESKRRMYFEIETRTVSDRRVAAIRPDFSPYPTEE